MDKNLLPFIIGTFHKILKILQFLSQNTKSLYTLQTIETTIAILHSEMPTRSS